MSRIGKKPIIIPEDVTVEINDGEVVVKGPKGELKRKIRPEIKVEKKDTILQLSEKVKNKQSNAFWGMERSLLFNMVEGVKNGFAKSLEMQGVGYRARMENEKLIIEAGFSSPVEMIAPEGVTVEVVKGKIKIFGIDKCQVGQFAAKIRAVRPPEPYKGKGIRYEGEEIVRKEGKKAVGSE